ncbi:hypothetical protein ACMFMF_004302 [Clarireedia jacksonii]
MLQYLWVLWLACFYALGRLDAIFSIINIARKDPLTTCRLPRMNNIKVATPRNILKARLRDRPGLLNSRRIWATTTLAGELRGLGGVKTPSGRSSKVIAQT